tara:strand:+ start:203 stop:406 length:204 start_codon:yes stop_codon:yes gene_type:complete
MPRKRSINIAGHKTSISLEDEFWDELAIIAKDEKKSVNALVKTIDETRKVNLSSAIRLFVLSRLKNK